MDTSTIRLPDGVHFAGIPSGPVWGGDAELSLLTHGERPEGLKLNLSFSKALWAELEAAGVFEATPERRGAQFGEWTDDAPLLVELELKNDAFTSLVLTTEDIFDMGSALLRGNLGLNEASRWKVRLVRQQQGPVRVGVRFKD